MEGVLLSLGSNAKSNELKEAVAAAKEALKNRTEKGDVPVAYVREKCVSAFELAFDHGNEKAAHAAVDGVQCLLRDRRFHSPAGDAAERPEHSLAAQLLNAFTGAAHWNGQLQCHCMTLIVELLSSVDQPPTLSEVQEATELCMRVFCSSREESARMSARAAVSQSVTSYCSNRYAVVDDPQENIAVYLDATSLLEGFVKTLDQIKTSNEQSVIVLDATHALLAAQPLTILSHTPFLNLLWKELCPLLIRLLGVPQKNCGDSFPIASSASPISVSPVPPGGAMEELPLGQGQMARFTLSPAVLSNPDASRALYLILEQLLRLLAAAPSLGSVLEALFHKAFLFPKIEQRSEAIKVIRKLVGEPRRIADIVRVSLASRSLSLWRMLVVCLVESATPQHDICIEAIRATGAMLQGLLDFSQNDQLLEPEEKEKIKCLFPSLDDATTQSFSVPFRESARASRESMDAATPGQVRGVPSISTDNESGFHADDEDELAEALRRLEHKFGILTEGDGGLPAEEEKEDVKVAAPLTTRRSTDEERVVSHGIAGRESHSSSQSETATARRFVEELCGQLSEWRRLRSTTEVDTAILRFASTFYQEFSAAHSERFRRRSAVQHEFLNTDALYIAAYACLARGFRGEHAIDLAFFKRRVLQTGCHVYASETWLEQVFEVAAASDALARLASPDESPSTLIDVIKDYDGLDHAMLTDHERLQRIRQGAADSAKCFEERAAARWLVTSAWAGVVRILATFVSVKDRRRARPKVQEAVEYAIGAMRNLANIALALDLGSRCGWIFEHLVEASCDVDALRQTATAEDNKRIALVDRDDLLSIQLVLDHAFVAVHAPECWKHVIRCTEFVWELEKYIYGSLCYEKPTASRFSFGGWRKEKKPEQPRPGGEEEGASAADRAVESALGDGRGPPERDRLNRAICILIAKTDRWYGKCGGMLALPSLQALVAALVAASENRILLQRRDSPSLTPPDSLIGRLSELLTHLPSRPLVHQMLTMPAVSAHLVHIACSPTAEARAAAAVLADTLASMVIIEQPGQAFNQMLVAPFQAVMCTEGCLAETRTQLIHSLADSVRDRSEKLGSGWKPLFGSLRAVRTLRAAAGDGGGRVAWIVLDVIGTYLGITKCSVLSWSLPECIGCVTHFLQSVVVAGGEESAAEEAASPPGAASEESADKSTPANGEGERRGLFGDEEDAARGVVIDSASASTGPTSSPESTLDAELSEAALRLVQPLFAVLINLYRTPHIPNPHLLHRLELRSRLSGADSSGEPELLESTTSSDCSASSLPPLSVMMDGHPMCAHSQRSDDSPSSYLDRPIHVPSGPLPWTANSDAKSSAVEPHSLAACELLLELFEQLSGALLTAPPAVQPPLVEAIQALVVATRASGDFGAPIAAYCVHALLMPHITAWTRRVALAPRSAPDTRAAATNHRHAVGAATAMVVSGVESNPDCDWETRLLTDILAVAVECLVQPRDTARVGVASLRHVATIADHFDARQWTVFGKALWDAWSATLCPLRDLFSHYASDDYGRSEEEAGSSGPDSGEVFVEGQQVSLGGRQRMLAYQVFFVDAQRAAAAAESMEGADVDGEGDASEDLAILCVNGTRRTRISVCDLVRALLAQQQLLQLVADLLAPADGWPATLSNVIPSLGSSTSAGLRNVPLPARLTLLRCLDASYLTSIELDSRPPLRALLSRLIGAPAGGGGVNLHRQAVAAASLRMHILFAEAEKDVDIGTAASLSVAASRLARCQEAVVGELARVERATVAARIAVALAREHHEQHYEFMLASDGERKRYAFVSENEINSTIAEFRKQRPLVLGSRGNVASSATATTSRANPFVPRTDNGVNASSVQEPLSAASLRLAACRECAMPLFSLLTSTRHFSALLPPLLPTLNALLLATPDISVRKAYLELTEKALEKRGKE